MCPFSPWTSRFSVAALPAHVQQCKLIASSAQLALTSASPVTSVLLFLRTLRMLSNREVVNGEAEEGAMLWWNRLLWWLLLIIRALSQIPELSTNARPWLFGRCTSLKRSLLGDFHHPSNSGLISHSLVTVAKKNQSSIYYTTELPSVRVFHAVRTCQSHDVSLSKYNTASFLVSYTCRGVACEQPSDNIQATRYVHLFSFACHTTNRYTTWDFIPGYEVHIDRTTTNSISNPVATASGSCSLCSNDPALKSNPLFNLVTGCICKCYES
jgi:hypothetical protein